MFALLALAALTALDRATTPGSEPGGEATTVRTGQTLSDIAAERLPHRPVTDAVTAIRLANGLNSAQVHPGQTLRVPRR